MPNKIGTYLKESWAEIKKVNWPTRKETTRHSLAVVTITFAIGLFLSLCDYVFKFLLKLIIQ